MFLQGEIMQIKYSVILFILIINKSLFLSTFAKENESNCDSIKEMFKLDYLAGQWLDHASYLYTITFKFKKNMLNFRMEDIKKEGDYTGEGIIAYDCSIKSYRMLYTNNRAKTDYYDGVLKGKDDLFLTGAKDQTYNIKYNKGNLELEWRIKDLKDGKWKTGYSTIAKPLR